MHNIFIKGGPNMVYGYFQKHFNGFPVLHHLLWRCEKLLAGEKLTFFLFFYFLNYNIASISTHILNSFYRGFLKLYSHLN